MSTRFLCCLLLGGLFTSSLSARGPVLDMVSPSGGTRGTQFDVELVGERLESASDLLFYRDGLEVEEIEIVDKDTIRATIGCRDDCPLGEFPFRVVTRFGLSNVATVMVSALPSHDEVEPNDRGDEAQRVKPNVTMDGTLTIGDVDTFLCRFESGQRVSLQVDAVRVFPALVDPQIVVIDPNGDELVFEDDTPMLGQDAAASFVAPLSGEYQIMLSEASRGGGSRARYRFHIGEFPRPMAVYPAGGPSGSEVALRFIGDASGAIERTMPLPEMTGRLGVTVNDPTSTPSPNWVRVSDLRNVLEVEPNDDRVSNPVAEQLPAAFNGIIETAGDVDCFAFQVPNDEIWSIQVFAMRLGSPLDSVVRIFDGQGTLVASNDDAALQDSSLRLVGATSPYYWLTVTDHLGRGGDSFVYRVEACRVKPELSLSIPVVRKNSQAGQSVVIPRGNRTVLMVSARRNAFRAPIDVNTSDLPEGVTANGGRISRDGHLTTMLFTADSDAPLSATLSPLTGTAEGVEVHGELEQKVPLVIGPPSGSTYHSVSLDRLAVAVVESAPFHVNVVEPQTPIVQDGRLNLRVRATRADGFDGPISLTMPFQPPWLQEVEEEVVIESGESEAEFPLVAVQRARPGDYKTVIVGTADIAGGDVQVASEFVPIRIAEPYVKVAITRTTLRQDQAGEVACRVQIDQTFANGAKAQLRGLPKGTVAEPVTIQAGQQDFVFPIRIGAATPASIHNTLFCELAIPELGEQVIHFTGRGGVLEVLREDERPRETRSRLEVLRQQRKRGEPDPSATLGDELKGMSK